MKYYKVTAKCGHVGRNYYIVKNFFVKTEDGKSAACKVRHMSRVKHHQKDAILSVNEITEEEYWEGRKQQAQDMYFNVHNSSEQRRCGAVDCSLVFAELKTIRRRKFKDHIYRHKLERIIRKDIQQQMRGEI